MALRKCAACMLHYTHIIPVGANGDATSRKLLTLIGKSSEGIRKYWWGNKKVWVVGFIYLFWFFLWPTYLLLHVCLPPKQTNRFTHPGRCKYNSAFAVISLTALRRNLGPPHFAGLFKHLPDSLIENSCGSNQAWVFEGSELRWPELSFNALFRRSSKLFGFALTQ